MVLGMDIADAEARRILEGLQIEVDANDPARWQCRPPTHRPDLAREEDLIEEVMRIHGLDELPAVASMPTAHGESAPTGVYAPAGALTRAQQDRLVDALAAQGLHEAVGFAFAEPDTLARLGTAAGASTGLVRLRNPMRGFGPVLRTHLLPGLLDAAALNVARHARPVRLFEVGRVYRWAEPPTGDGPTAAIDRVLPEEPLRAGVLLVGARGADDEGGGPVDGRALAGILLDALRCVGLFATIVPGEADDPELSHLHPGVRGRLELDGRAVGSFGAVHPELASAWNLPDGVPVVYGELSVDALPVTRAVRFSAVPRFPATSRDLSIDLAVDVPASAVVQALEAAGAAIRGAGARLHADDPPRLDTGVGGRSAVEVVEDYRGTGVEPGRRALLLRLGYRAAERTVTDDEVQALHGAIVEAALEALRQRDPAARVR
jgi:phenylalanyl-tRNA synthetase beta chain